MRGKPHFNGPEFTVTAAKLRSMGHSVFSPHEADAEDGWVWAGMDGTDDELKAAQFDMRRATARNMAALLNSTTDGIVLMSGWKDSQGAVTEAKVAMNAGLRLLELRDGTLYPVQASTVLAA